MLDIGLAVAFGSMLSFAASDVMAKRVSSKFGSRRANALMLASNLMVMLAAGALLGISKATPLSIILSAASGISYAIAYFLVYKSLETQQVSSTISLVGIEYVLLTLFGISVLGEAVSYLAVVGIIGVFIGSFLVTSSRGLKINRHYLPAIMGMVAFAMTYILLIFAQQDSGGPALPLIINRIFAVSITIAYLRYSRPAAQHHLPEHPRHRRQLMTMNVLMGVFNGLGSLLYLILAQYGAVAVGSAIVASEPALMVFLGSLLYRDRFSRHQFFGISLVIISTILLSL